jgi:hypothetical protein
MTMNKDDRARVTTLQGMRTRYLNNPDLPTTSRQALSKACERRLDYMFERYRASAELDDLLPLPMRDNK